MIQKNSDFNFIKPRKVKMPIKIIIILLKEQQLLIMSMAFSCLKQFLIFHILCPFSTWNEIDPYYFESSTNHYEIILDISVPVSLAHMVPRVR